MTREPAGRPGEAAAAAGGWRGVLLALRFLTELALLAVLAVVGAELGDMDMVAASVGLAVLLPLAAVAVWGAVVAPRARRRIADPARLLVELALFAGSAAALAGVGHLAPAVVFALVAVGCAAAVRVVSPGS